MRIFILKIIYKGDRKERLSELRRSKEFFDEKAICLDITVKIVYNGKKGDIVNRYVAFTRGCNEQVMLYGRTRKTTLEEICLCKDKDVL